MSRSIRIRTTPDSDEKYVKVKLEQDFDLLEILSLKITQEEAYQSFCANYGVVAGRISINDGFGIPNVKVSIFVPISEDDKENEIIREIYPYEATSDKNRNGVRYNLLPKRKQHTDHTPVGTFPDKREVLDDENYVEVYEKYYKYTAKTNESGDFMLFGIPTGEQQLFYDLDVSDIGFLSARPFELIAQGFPESKFQDKFTFLENDDLQSLTQIRSETIPVFVKPFWCDTLNLGQEIGITRQDIPIRDYELKPTAIFMGSLFSDDEKDSVSKNCRPRKKSGQMNELITGEGNIDIIRRTQQGDIEFYRDLGDDLIDENGNWSFQVPMNLRKVVTAEDGSLVPSPDGIKGIATEADVRFRISMDKSNDDKRLRTRAKMLVPNMTGNYSFDTYDREELRDAENNNEPIFKINDQTSLTPQSLSDDPANEYNRLEEFFTFRWKKVYTVRQYIGRFQPNNSDENRNFIGIKDISDGFGVNKVPFNRIDTNVNALYALLCFLLSVVGIIFALINSILNLFNSLITGICNIKIPCGISATSFKAPVVKVRYYVQNYDASESIKWGKYLPGGNVGKSSDSPLIDMDALSGGDFDIDANLTCGDIDPWVQGAAGWDAIGGPLINDNGVHTSYKYINNPGNGSARFPAHSNVGSNYKVGTAFGFNNMVCPSGVGPTGTVSNPGGWCYNHPDCIGGSTVTSGCRRWRFDTFNLASSLDNCEKKTDTDLKDACPGVKFLGRCWQLKVRCVIGGVLCKDCRSSNDTQPRHGCCKPGGNPGNPGCGQTCDDWKGKDDGVPYSVYVNCTKWSGDKVVPCETPTGDDDEDPVTSCCGDCCTRVPLIGLNCPDGSPAGCGEKPLLFGVGGVCSKGVVKPCLTCAGFEFTIIRDWVRCRLERIASQLGVVKFDFYNDWVNGSLYFPLVKRKYKVKKRKKKFGQIKKDKFCDFNCYDNFNDTNTSTGEYLLDPTQINSPGETNNRKFDLDHGKPKYVEYLNEDLGFTQFYNVRGHGHHQNKCNKSFLIERKEFTKHVMDCKGNNLVISPDDPELTNYNVDDDEPSTGNCNCDDGACTWGTKACGRFCSCSNEESGYNGQDYSFKHGIVKYENGEIYYASIIPKESSQHIGGEYTKRNLLFPTNITELGSSTFCDIDDQPFVVDKLEPTSYKISEQPVSSPGVINLSTYADIACTATKCINPKNTVMSSQLGVEILDITDDDKELNTCQALFDHEENTREYFCKRFDTFTDSDLNIHYNLPASVLRENEYSTYPEILDDTPFVNISLGPQNTSTINDGDGFTPGDRCKMGSTNGKFIYGVEHQTENLIDNPTTLNGHDGVSFHTSQTPYYFYFGLVPGKTALHKTVGKFFADKINEETLEGVINYIPDSPTQPGGTKQSAASLLATCLNKS